MRALLVTLLIASTATLTAALSFVASVKEGGRDVDASRLKFVPIPPARHRKHPSRSQSQSHSDPGKHARDVISYSSNWCGASQHADGPDEVANVFSYFTVPDLTLRPGAPAPQFAAAWVGIDGAECRTALLQAGVTTIVRTRNPNAAISFHLFLSRSVFSKTPSLRLGGRSTRTAARARRRGGSGIPRRHIRLRVSRSSRATGCRSTSAPRTRRVGQCKPLCESEVMRRG